MKRNIEILREDFESVCDAKSVLWEALRKKTILITGATGLIGSTIIGALLYADEKYELELSIIGLIRDSEKAKVVLGKYIDNKDNISLKIVDLQEKITIDGNIDYIIHGASPTSSHFFVTKPVEMIQTTFLTTMNLLQLAVEKEVSGFVYLSTMEVYGHQQRGQKITEENIGAFKTENVRNCYPIGKIAAENLCNSYANEYRLPIKIARLTQTFGPGVEYTDNRIFAEFARCAIEKRNIVLKTKGETERSYLYTADAVSAILTILISGKNGQAYTVANGETYCSIYEMARMVAELYNIDVVIEEQDIAKLGYADTLYIDLSTEKIEKLGWTPKVKLADMYIRMIEDLKEKSNE